MSTNLPGPRMGTHPSAYSAAASCAVMVVRTGPVSSSLDVSERLNDDFLECWAKLVDDGLSQAI